MHHYVNEGDVIAVVVKQRDGRPIKIEGNELSSITKGGTRPCAGFSMDLYDTTPSSLPMQNVGKILKK